MLKDKSLYKQGTNRKEALLFPPSIDEYISDDSIARAIDIYVDSLDLLSLGFKDTRKSTNIDGAKAYHPSLLLKIYIYGYLNKIRSSRNLERECRRNIELMFLTKRLYPKYHTISDFRKNNSKALQRVFKEFKHPFGTIKRTLGWDHFLVRGLEKVKGENALIMFTYNFKRLLNLIGIPLFKKAIATLKTNNKSKIKELREEIRRYILTLLLIRTEFRLKLRLM